MIYEKKLMKLMIWSFLSCYITLNSCFSFSFLSYSFTYFLAVNAFPHIFFSLSFSFCISFLIRSIAFVTNLSSTSLSSWAFLASAKARSNSFFASNAADRRKKAWVIKAQHVLKYFRQGQKRYWRTVRSVLW